MSSKIGDAEMKKKWIAAAVCLTLLVGLGGCKGGQPSVSAGKEDSGGTGFGVSQKSILSMQDLYFLRPGIARAEVEAALGSPQTYVLTSADTVTYRLQDGETLELTYSKNGWVEKARFTDTAGEEGDLFAYLSELGIISNYESDGSYTSEKNEEKEPENDEGDKVQQPQTDAMAEAEASQYFAIRRYSYSMAEQIITLGAERQTVVSALGKPNSYGSVTYAKDSYIIDIYVMEDGSSLQLDYGYSRNTLRAVRKVQGTEVLPYLGEWGQEEKPENFYRHTRNVNLFSSLKKGSKPSEIYRSYGEPDWLEGNANHYRVAYMMADGAVFYMDFGSNNSSLSAASLQETNGAVTVYTLR